MLMRNPVVTGLGIITAAGCGIRAVWEAIRAGREGLGPLTLFASPRHGRHLVGQVRGDVGALAGAVRGSRTDKLAWIAAREAWANAGLDSDPSAVRPERLAVSVGSTVGGMGGTEAFLARLLTEGKHRFGSLRFHECASSADLCAKRLGAAGPVITFSTACSAGAMAIVAAAELIEQDEVDVVVAGGADALCRLTLNGFGSLLLLDPDGCRPFDVARAGISLGEGAGMLVLEAEEFARRRGAPILARLAGWGASCDASHATSPHPEGDGALAAMAGAVHCAGLAARDVSLVCAHGTGTPDNDLMEARALRRLFGDRPPPFSSVKRVFGHTLAASGAIKAVVCVKALQEQALLPSAGFRTIDPAIGLEPVRRYVPHPLEHVLGNSFGFGGNNVALLFSRPSRPATTQPAAAPAILVRRETPDPRSRRLAVLGAGLVSPAGHSVAAILGNLRTGPTIPLPFETRAPLPAGRTRVYTCGEFGAAERLPSGRRRKLGHLQQMVIVAAHGALPGGLPGSVSPSRVCTAIGTGFGALTDTAAFVENLLANEERAPLPTRFTNSVHNGAAAQLAIEFGLRGLNSTPTQREISFEAALWHAGRALAENGTDLALAGAADELSPYLVATGMRWGWWTEQTPEVLPLADNLKARERPLPGEGAAVFLLATSDAGRSPIGHVTAVRLGRWTRAADGRIDAIAAARWILETLERDAVSLDEVDLVLSGANGWAPLDASYRAVSEALSGMARRRIPLGGYKQFCGEHHAASGFGMCVALALVRGEIPVRAVAPADVDRVAGGDARCRKVILYTLSPSGAHAMCCVSA